MDNDPLLTPTPSTSESHDVPVIHMKKLSTNQHIQFRIGDTVSNSGPEHLDILQELLTSQHSPTTLTPNEGLVVQPPKRLDSASSISSTSSAEFNPPVHSKTQPEANRPTEVLVELYDLKLENELAIRGHWEETARWIKYEEDVEGVDHRWGAPHISFLSFHALLQLRKCIAKGMVLLDADVQDFMELNELIADAITADEFGAPNTRRIAQILRLKHTHVRNRRISRITTAASSIAHLLERGIAPERTQNYHHPTVVPRRSQSSAMPLSQSASNMVLRKFSAEPTTMSAADGNFRPHVRSFAASPPTIAEDDECAIEFATDSVHRGERFSQSRGSTPNVQLNVDNAHLSPPQMSSRKVGELAIGRENFQRRSWKRRQSWNLNVDGGGHPANSAQRHKMGAAALDNGPAVVATGSDVTLRRLAVAGATELVQVMVGELKWMRKARFVMVRFPEGKFLPELVDNCFPIRIIFVILGPPLCDGSYHELGRSLATLMSNTGDVVAESGTLPSTDHHTLEPFPNPPRCFLAEDQMRHHFHWSLTPPTNDRLHRFMYAHLKAGRASAFQALHFKSAAFCARDKSQLVEGLDTFLDGSVVIPSGEIDSNRLISTDELRKFCRRRKREREMNKQKVGDENPQPQPTGTAESADAATTDEQQWKQSLAVGNGRTDNKQKAKKEGRKRCRDFPLFKGLRADISHRFPLYWSDIRDAANFQCLTSVVFMFFASFVPAISFGGLMGKYTDEHIGTIETLFAQCICGIIWALFSAQPLMIMSATGPVLIFEASLYTFCDSLQLDFLTVRFYAGLFIMLIAICIAALDGSRLLIYVTRFTEDIFATLISAIFIAESLHFIWHTFKENPVEDYNYYEKIHVNCRRHAAVATGAANKSEPDLAPMLPLPFDIEGYGNSTRNRTADMEASRRLVAAITGVKDPSSTLRLACGEAEPNTALLTAIIVFATFILAFLLKKLRESFYLGKHLRRAIGDFGVLISITFVALIVHLFIPDPYLQRLDMPDHINFTNLEKRGHGLIISPKLNEWYGAVVALIAALLVFILLFVETEITELLLSRKERGCSKGSGSDQRFANKGSDWDLVLMGICAFLCSVFGLPWMCAAAVQSLAHCSSLTVMKKTAPGARPEVDHVIEQRVTTIGVAILIGLIAFGGSYLRLPLASLFGVFLYLGVMNLCGVQLVQRVVLFFIPEKYFPVTPYTEQMSIWRMHFYTWIQLVCLFIVYTVKYFKKTALAFPFVLMLFILLRQIVLPRFFTDKELRAIDGEDHSEDEEWADKDYYNNAPIPV